MNYNNINENCYEIIQDYDGFYKFTLEENKQGYTVTGVIEFNNGNCKMQYIERDNKTKELKWNIATKYEGFCGLNPEDNSNFYFSVNTDSKYSVRTYKCVSEGKDLSCELKSSYDITGNSNNKLNLIYIGNSYDLEANFNRVLYDERVKIDQDKQTKEDQDKQTFISSCKECSFEQLKNNPDYFRGTNVKISGKVLEIEKIIHFNNLKVNITKNGTYYTDTIVISYNNEEIKDKIEKDDVITIYGTTSGETLETGTLGEKIALPFINAKYIEL